MRCILAIPELEPSAPVDILRQRFDPLYGKVPAHITLVFPFDIPVRNEAVALHMQRVFQACTAITVTFDACRVGRNGYAYLPVLSGASVLKHLYNQLHLGPLQDAGAQQRFTGAFRPHLTIGHINSAEDAFAVARLAAGVHRGLCGYVTSVWLETILPHNQAQVEHVVQICGK